MEKVAQALLRVSKEPLGRGYWRVSIEPAAVSAHGATGRLTWCGTHLWKGEVVVSSRVDADDGAAGQALTQCGESRAAST